VNRSSAVRSSGVRIRLFCSNDNDSQNHDSAIMAESKFAEHATDNNPDLQYIRMLGAGAFGSVHEVLYIPRKMVQQ
jgi:hypothetical protein